MVCRQSASSIYIKNLTLRAKRRPMETMGGVFIYSPQAGPEGLAFFHTLKKEVNVNGRRNENPRRG